jgi:thiol-disulfide isomerase/thioredoxin
MGASRFASSSQIIAMADGIKSVNSVPEFNSLLDASKAPSLLVVDFHALWCAPCRMCTVPECVDISNSR